MRWRALPAFAAIDFLSCLLVVFVAVALTSRPPRVTTYGQYAAVITWPAGDNDVDLYMRDAAGAVCFFASPQLDAMQLEHDDLGVTGSAYTGLNAERIVLRQAAAGEYVINVHMYRRGAGTVPIRVAAELWRLRGEDTLVSTRTVTVAKNGDERTAFRFRLDQAGGLAQVSDGPAVSLVSPTTTYGGSTERSTP